MSGIMCAVAGNTYGGVNTNLAGASITDTALTTARVQLDFMSDGTVNLDRATASDITDYQDWYLPTGGSPGSTYFVRFNTVSGSPNIGTAGTWQLVVGASIGVQRVTTVGSSVYTFTASFSTDSGGSNIVHTTTNYTLTATISP